MDTRSPLTARQAACPRCRNQADIQDAGGPNKQQVRIVFGVAPPWGRSSRHPRTGIAMHGSGHVAAATRPTF